MSICKYNRKALKLYVTRNLERDWEYCSEKSNCFYCTLVQMGYMKRINELPPYENRILFYPKPNIDVPYEELYKNITVPKSPSVTFNTSITQVVFLQDKFLKFTVINEPKPSRFNIGSVYDIYHNFFIPLSAIYKKFNEKIKLYVIMEQMTKISYLKKKDGNKGFVQLIKKFSDVKIKFSIK